MLSDECKEILEHLNEDRYVTASELARKCSCSKKTISNRIKILKQQLEKKGAIIESKSSEGYKLVIVDRDKFAKQNERIISYSNDSYVPNDSHDRLKAIIARLLNTNGYVKIDDIADKFYVSRNTISKDLQEVKGILETYQLSLEYKSHYGLKLSGLEDDKRKCSINIFLKNELMKTNNNNNYIYSIAEILDALLKEKRLEISDFCYGSLVNHIYMSVVRMTRGFYVVYDENKKKDIEKEIGEFYLEAAKELWAKLKDRFELSYTDDELYYVALHLYSKCNGNNENVVVPDYINELVDQMLIAIKEINNIDLKNDLELKMFLSQHMVQLDIRMKYNITLKNPLLYQVKKEYTFAYAIANSACTVLNQYYGKQLPDDEIGYLAVIFELVLRKSDQQKPKYNIVVVCSSGRGMSRLFMYKYKQEFSQYIDSIYECSLHELRNYDFSSMHIDYIFTTIPLSETYPVPVYEISLSLNDKEIKNVINIFENKNSSFLERIFPRELFVADLEADNKEIAIKKLCDLVAKNKKVPDNLYELVMKREKLGQTDFGNGVAFPHAYKAFGNETFVACGILRKPLWWGHDNVQIVFLVTLAENSDIDLNLFYKIIMNFIASEKLTDEVKKDKTYESLIANLLKSDY